MTGGRRNRPRVFDGTLASIAPRLARARDELAPVGEIAFPPEWVLGRSVGFTETLGVFKRDAGGRIVIAGGVLDDGTNLIGMCFPGGQRVLRSAPPDWQPETRATGRCPEDCLQLWGTVIESVLVGHAEARRIEALPAEQKCATCKGGALLVRGGRAEKCRTCNGTGMRA